MQNSIEIKTGGLLLLLASTTVLITIFFEYKIGWIGIQRNQDESILFIFENWKSLQIIWGWQK